MKLTEHNKKWEVSRKKTDEVLCHTGGYGELSQYDPKCASCWLGHSHTWEKHNDSLNGETKKC